MKLVLCLLSSILLLTGCATWDGFSPATQAVLKAGAKLALSYGVQELGDRVQETRPYLGQLNTLIETTFSKPLSAEETGEVLRAEIAKLPVPLQSPVLAQFKESLTGAKTVAASPGNASFNQLIASKL